MAQWVKDLVLLLQQLRCYGTGSTLARELPHVEDTTKLKGRGFVFHIWVFNLCGVQFCVWHKDSMSSVSLSEYLTFPFTWDEANSRFLLLGCTKLFVAPCTNTPPLYIHWTSHSTLLFFFKIVLAISGSLFFQKHFTVSCQIITLVHTRVDRILFRIALSTYLSI